MKLLMAVVVLLVVRCLSAATGVSSFWESAKGANTTNASTTIYGILGFGGSLGANTPTAESSAQSLMRTSGTMTKFCTYFSTMDRGAGSVQMRKATSFNTSYSDGNLVISLTAAGGAGEYCDLTHNDVVTAGEYWDWKLVTGSGGTTSIIRHAGVVFAASSASVTVTKFGGTDAGSNQANNTTYRYPLTLTVSPTSFTTENFGKTKAATSGTWRNAWINLLTNTFSTSGTMAVRINGSDGNQIVSVGTTTGPITFEDNTHTDPVQQGDLLNYQFVTSTGTGAATADQIGSEFQTTNFSIMPVSGSTANSGAGGSLNAGTTNYIPAGALQTSTTIGDYATDIKLACQASRLSVLVTVDSLTAAQTGVATVMKTGSAGNLTATFVGGTTVPVYISDNVHSDIFAAGDTFQYRLVLGTGTSLTTNNYSVLWSYPSPTMGQVTM